MSNRMRAIVVREFGPPSVLEVAERPAPEPGSGEVSIDVAFAGVGFVDTLLRAGRFPLSTPFVPGIEVGGCVRAVGPDVEDLAPGQLVAAMLNDFGRSERLGGYAEVAIAHHSMVVAVPDSADLARVTAATVNGVTAWIALHDLARVSPDDRVLVLGASGGLGSIACRLAALHPVAQILGVVRREPRRAPNECSAVILADELDAKLVEVAPEGIDVVIDPVGGLQRRTGFEHLAPFGRHIVVGDASAEDSPLSGDAAWLNSRAVIGLNVGGIAHLRPALVTRALSAVVSLIANGTLSEPDPVTLPLEEAGRVHQMFADGVAPTKMVLTVN